MSRTYLITGAAGFIGSAVIKKLLQNNQRVVGIDNLNDYYDTSLKEARLEDIKKSSKFIKKWTFIKASLEDFNHLENILNCHFWIPGVH